MSNAKEKAKELVEKYLNMNDGLIQEFIPIPIEGAKQCALIAVNEIWNELESARVFEEYYYWQDVKQEIEKL
jgi:glutathione synthase/RimK-type ligase-like ATP-grasp enzyme